LGTTKRLDEVAVRTDLATSWAVTRLARLAPVELDVDRRVVERKAVLEVAERRDPGQFLANLFGKGAVLARFGPVTLTSTGVGEPKLMTSLTMSAGSNESRTPGICCASAARSRSLSARYRPSSPPSVATRRIASSGPPPLEDGVDRVGRRQEPDRSRPRSRRCPCPPPSRSGGARPRPVARSSRSVSRRVPACGAWNRPASTLGKISTPSVRPTRKTTASETAR